MVAPVVGAAIVSGIGSLFGGLMGGKGAAKAAKQQRKAVEAGIAEQRREYDMTRSDFQPFRDAGLEGLGGYGDLVGINGADKWQAAIDALHASPLYQSLYRNGLNTTLANASATGGLRGGDTQHSLYDLGQDTLSAVIQQQLGNLAPLISVGSGATGAVANAGQNAANNVTNLIQQGGAARAGASLTQAGIWQGVIGNLTNSINSILFPSQQKPAFGGSGGGF